MGSPDVIASGLQEIRRAKLRPSATMAFKNVAHLFRIALAFAIGFAIFLVVRELLVPKSFGRYGHYRGDALNEIASRPISYAGHEVCETCHADVLDVKKRGRHARVACESCHGPLANHAQDPASVVPAKLDTAVLCVRCHEANHSKPMDFPQVHSADHSAGLPCNTCHQ
ncbi:MAG TPA: multiheme c-type cytochrome, partial [Methylomirabilota bacterium]|nr:multiheme c-type cytochrome [Methylomirabilota bacterium]